MAKYTISQFTMPDGNIVELKDKVAREAVTGGIHFLGVTSTEISDGSSTTSITIGGESVTVANGDIVVYGNKEFIYATSDLKWHELGDVTNLGAMALADTASASYTPAGTVSQPTFSGTAVSYTPAGTVSKPDVDVTPTAINISEFDNAGSVTAGSAAACTLPTLSFTPDASTENLTIAWTAGSFTANTPTSVTLPTSKSTEVLSGVSAALHAAPTFSGTAADITAAGTVSQPTFSGTAATITVSPDSGT